MPDADVLGALSNLASAKLPDLAVDFLEKPGEQIFYPDPDLSAKLNAALDVNSDILRDKRKRLAFAIVDLTEDPQRGFGLGRPAYAGVNDIIYATVASLAKLLPLYGAYQLRYALRKQLAKSAGIPVAKISDIDTLAKRTREGFRFFRSAESGHDIPLIEKMFMMKQAANGPDFDLDFWRGTETDTVLAGIDKNDPRKSRTYGRLRDTKNLADELDLPADDTHPARLKFFEQMRLMVGWSNDISAAIVIESLGFLYLWKLSSLSGLFRNAWDFAGVESADNRRGGLFLAGDYWHSRWAAPPDPSWSKPPMETPPRPPMQGGTARSMALLMTALAQGRLVGEEGAFDVDAHAEMRELLRNIEPPCRERSPIGDSLLTYKPPTWDLAQTPWKKGDQSFPDNLAVSKLGLLGPDPKTGFPGHVSNAVLIRAGRGPGVAPITAALVGISNVNSDDTPLSLFARVAVDILEQRHP